MMMAKNKRTYLVVLAVEMPDVYRPKGPSEARALCQLLAHGLSRSALSGTALLPKRRHSFPDGMTPVAKHKTLAEICADMQEANAAHILGGNRVWSRYAPIEEVLDD